MTEFLLNEKVLKEINKDLTNDGIVIKNSINSCFSSWDYYETIQLKISSVVRSIIKNHYFKDGNKRTAFIAFLILSKENGIELKNKIWYKIFIEIASNSYSVEKIAELLFK